MKITDIAFFSKAPDCLAKALIGKIICRRMSDGFIMRCRITETEAYFGNESFCYGHNKSEQNQDIIFYSTGRLCCYSDMLMISCHSADIPDNVLIRSVDCYSGPLAVCEALDINKSLNNEYLTESGIIWIEEDKTAAEYNASQRINIKDDSLLNFRLKKLIY